jgi:peptidylprolyl isomerase
MKLNQFLFIAVILAAGCAASAQTTAKPATTTARPATAKSGTTATHTAATSTANKLVPPGVPAVRGIVKSAPFTLRYEDIAIGTGPIAAPDKLYKVAYTGYLGVNGRPDDGHKFDSSHDHPAQPIVGMDGKTENGDDGKPKMAPGQPLMFQQGVGRLIPGFDQGFEGMKVGGKRRLFIPWQLAYGATGRPGPDPAHPVIPPKANLIFDIELVDMADMPAAPPRPPMPQAPQRPFGAVTPPRPAAPGAPATTTAPASPPKATAPAQPATPP